MKNKKLSQCGNEILNNISVECTPEIKSTSVELIMPDVYENTFKKILADFKPVPTYLLTVAGVNSLLIGPLKYPLAKFLKEMQKLNPGVEISMQEVKTSFVPNPKDKFFIDEAKTIYGTLSFTTEISAIPVKPTKAKIKTLKYKQ